MDRASDDPRLPYAMRTGERLEGVVSRAREAVAVRADVADAAAMAQAVETASDRFGGLDAVLACAGMIAGGVPA